MAELGTRRSCKQQPGVTAPIVGASKPSHLEKAVKSVDLELEGEELRARVNER
jgi:aryl-alcohol dehydrogenase-like predicted oxidoreductase